MSLEFALRPSSIEGIKRLADRIEREESIKRAEALERASRSAGFSNYAHARRSLAESPAPEARRHDLHITAYWHDLPTGETGRETLVIAVDHRLDEMIVRRQFANNRHLLAFRRKESDHVEGKQVFEVAPLSRTPYPLSSRCPRWQERGRRTRRSFASR